VHRRRRRAAQALAEEVGGEAVTSGAEVAQRADVVVLCHKPTSCRPWRPRSRRTPRRSSRSSPRRRSMTSRRLPGPPVYRILPSTPVEVRQGAVILAADDEQDPELDAAIRALLEELGTLVVLDDAMVDVAMGLMSNAPAYYALVVEAQVDAGVRHGLTADQASRLVVQTMAGTAELLRRQGYDTLARAAR
jgi:pyrroline-5-carboxylate reductase